MQEGAGPYAFNKDQWVGYEDPTSITEKVNYAMTNNLGGVVGWTVDLDDFNNICCAEPFPLLRAANRALGRKVPSPPMAPCERPTAPVTPAPPITTTAFETGVY
jgi:chitinase